MATRTAFAGTAVDGNVAFAADANALPGGWIGDVQATSDQGTILAETDLTSLSVTVTAGLTRRLKLSARVMVVAPSSGTSATLRIKEGSTVLQEATHDFSSLGLTDTLVCFVTVTPTSGAHTYKLSLLPIGGTFATEAAATRPNILLVEDVGPAS